MFTCLADVDLSVVHEVEDGGEVGEADAVQEDHGLRVRVLLQHLPSGSFRLLHLEFLVHIFIIIRH